MPFNAVKQFLDSKQNLLALFSLVPLGIWIYSRVWMVNPAILGDEYLYSMNARKALPWDPSPAGDFSNYLFNFVYQSTNLCGDNFYSCAKTLNIVFYLGFVLTLFIVASRFLPFWVSYAFMFAAALSPLSVYTSMFLPESLYMFCMGLLLIAVLKAINEFSWKNWAIVGLVIGIASLVKPHAWLSAIAVGLTLLIVGLGNRKIGLKRSALSALGLTVGAALARVVVGLLVAGPKALGFFGQYLSLNTVAEVVSGPTALENVQVTQTSPMTGVFALFGPQLNIHALTVTALMAISVVSVLSAVLGIFRTRTLTPRTAFALFSLVWLLSLMIEIVIFTGWVTGSGDDHTTRVLLRYYEFLFVIVPLAGLVSAWAGLETKVFARWVLAALATFLITPAFSGFFATLTIQIADAPTLAGLVVNFELFNAIAISSVLALLVYATFPRFTAYAILLTLPLSIVGVGWQIQDQYQGFRGSENAADKAGKYLASSLTETEVSTTIIVANTRFDATLAALWADERDAKFELHIPGTQLDVDFYRSSYSHLVTVGDVQLVNIKPSFTGEGFAVYNLAK